MKLPARQHSACKLVNHTAINDELCRLDFDWAGPPPGAGQFFMLRQKASSVFLGRPVSAAFYKNARTSFIIARRGAGTRELCALRVGDEAELTGPLGNAWHDFCAAGASTPVALIGGGVGLAPLAAFTSEPATRPYDFYAGLKTGFHSDEERSALLGHASSGARNLIIATEDGSEGKRGRIPDFLDAAQYTAVYACGPEPMLKAVASHCKAAGVPCFVSLERRMACGVGACLGCTVRTVSGNRRCCADGPIFPSEELFFDE
jgi:NAD(P)H-flavin reductase